MLPGGLTWDDRAVRGAEPAQAPVVWLTGLSGAGKSTLAGLAADELRRDGVAVEVLDGDEIRAQLSPELGFTRADREANVRRVAYVAALLARHGIVVLAPVIAPYRRSRAQGRELVGEPFIEVYVHAPLATLERRDTKGLYALARSGELDCLTGVTDRYEPPERPDLLIETDAADAERSASLLLRAIRAQLEPSP